MEYTIWICFIILGLAKVHDQEIVDVNLTLCIRQLLRFCSNQQRLEFEPMAISSQGHLMFYYITVLWISSCQGFESRIYFLPENFNRGLQKLM